MSHRNRTIFLATLLCTFMLAGFAVAQTSGTSKPGSQKFMPAPSNAPAVIDQQITSTMRVEHPDATGFIYRLDQIWAPYVASAEIDDEGGHEEMRPDAPKSNLPDVPESAMQTFNGPPITLTSGLSVDGLGAGISGPNGTFVVNSVPPDTNLAVGTTQVVETVNSGFAVYNKATGVMTAGPYNLTALWSVLPANSPCTGVDGSDGVSISDPVVVHDQFAQRWLITVLALPYNASTGALIAPFYHCVAISATDDATGSWSVFEYNPGSLAGITNDLPDYPKMGVWRDAYTFTYDQFNSTGSSYVAGEICGMDRNAMLNNTTITIICFEKTSTDYAMLPANMDGSTYPNLQTSGTAGTDTCTTATPCQPKSIFFELQDVSGASTTLEYYRVHFNFATTSHSAVDTRGTITVSSYNTTTCTNTSQCAVQPTHTGSLPSGETFASESKLDTLADHAMWRAAYRNFGSFESVVFDSSVRGTVASTAEPRWYELQGINTATGTGTPTVQQQSTFNPDTNATFRWMGSMASDHNNNMLLGYSASSSTVFPSLYITGRLSTDSASTMETETQAYIGQNSQVNITEGGNSYAYGYRWGDYSSMMVDPDDCTFWYANLYMKQAGLFNWNTRMVSYAFPGCSDSASITLPIPNAEGGTVLTSGTATFDWTSGTGSPSYTLSVGSTQGGTDYFTQSYPAGTYTATVTTLPTDGSTFWVRLTTVGGAGGFQDYQYTAPSLASFTLTPSPSSTTATQGGTNGTSTITVNPSGGFSGSVTLSATNVPTGVTAQFGTNPTTSTSLLTLTAGPTSSAGSYTVTVNGISGALNAQTTVGLTVNAGTPGIYSPVNGSTFSGNSATFSWIGYPGATAYWLDVGKEPGGNEYEQSGSLSSSTFSQNVSSLPSDGSTVYATWYYFISGSWQSIAYTYTAFGGGGVKGVVTSPAPNSTLSGTSVVFSWSAGSGSTAYWIDAGSSAGGNQYFQSGNLGNVLTKTVTGLPSDGSTVYVTLYSLVSGQWLPNAYTYTAYSLAASAGVLTTPTPGSVLTGSTVTFDWTAGAGASAYWLDVGSTSGGNQYYQSGNLGGALTTTVSGLPTDGSPIYATLYSLVGGQWTGTTYNYTAFSATGTLAAMTSPPPNSFINGTSATFTWSLDSSATAYWVDISAVGPGGNDVFQSGNLGNVSSVTVNSLPGNGSSTLYVTLYSYVGGQWLSNAYTYTN